MYPLKLIKSFIFQVRKIQGVILTVEMDSLTPNLVSQDIKLIRSLWNKFRVKPVFLRSPFRPYPEYHAVDMTEAILLVSKHKEYFQITQDFWKCLLSTIWKVVHGWSWQLFDTEHLGGYSTQQRARCNGLCTSSKTDIDLCLVPPSFAIKPRIWTFLKPKGFLIMAAI